LKVFRVIIRGSGSVATVIAGSRLWNLYRTWSFVDAFVPCTVLMRTWFHYTVLTPSYRSTLHPCSSESRALAQPISTQQMISSSIDTSLTPLGHNPLWVSRKEAAHPNVGQPQPELYYALQTETSSCMWWTAILETVYVVLSTRAGRINGWIMLAHLLSEESGIVDTLCT
jgi:hypothetical protein